MSLEWRDSDKERGEAELLLLFTVYILMVISFTIKILDNWKRGNEIINMFRFADKVVMAGNYSDLWNKFVIEREFMINAEVTVEIDI